MTTTLMKEAKSVVCEGSSHCFLNSQNEVMPDIVLEASKCVGDFLAIQVRPVQGIPENRTPFDASTEPLIAVGAYFARICTYSRITPETIICSYINLKKVCQNHPQHELTTYNAHRLLVSSMMVFAKYYDDDLDSNARWARIAGVAVRELNSLEVDFLNLCQFDLKVSCELFHETVHELLCFHHHEPIRTQIPLFNPTASFYAPRSSTTEKDKQQQQQQQHDEPQAAPSPCSNVMTTPRSRNSLARQSSQHHHHDTDHKDDSSDTSNSHHRRKNLTLLMNLFRHHHHKHHKESTEEPGSDAPDHLQFHPSNHPSNTPSVASGVSPPTSPRDNDHPRVSGGKMPRNHSNLSLSGLIHALSPTSKPFARRTHLEPEVDK